MSNSLKPRRYIPLAEEYFCDGAYYVITSTSLGGSDLTPQEVSAVLSEGDEPEVKKLLRRGVCLPLSFPGDCALNQAIIVLGDLTEQEADEWSGRISWKLDIPCGRLVVLCGGGDEEEFAEAVSGNPPEEHYKIFEVIDVPPGEYLVEIYAYVSSMTVDFYFEDDEPLEEWFQRTRPGVKLPLWLQYFKAGRAIGELKDDLVSYLIRLSPLQTAPRLPKLVVGMGWCGEFEFRRPELCPLGIERSAILAE